MSSRTGIPRASALSRHRGQRPAEWVMSAMVGLTPAQGREMLETLGREVALRLVRHLSVARPEAFRGDEWFESWPAQDLERKAVEVLFSGAPS